MSVVKSESPWCAPVFLCLFAFFFSQTALADRTLSLLEIWKNNQAVKLLQNKKSVEALELFTELAVQNQESHLLLFNHGGAFYAVEQEEKALKSFLELAEMDSLDPQLAFFTHFNLGVLYSSKSLNNLDKALEHYQKALAFYPESVEVKTNIELLFQGGEGQGDGDSDDQDDKGDEGQDGESDQDDDEQPEEPQEFTNEPQQPQKYKGDDLSPQDVNQILEELKKQEQNIRAKDNRKSGKEADREKDW